LDIGEVLTAPDAAFPTPFILDKLYKPHMFIFLEGGRHQTRLFHMYMQELHEQIFNNLKTGDFLVIKRLATLELELLVVDDLRWGACRCLVLHDEEGRTVGLHNMVCYPHRIAREVNSVVTSDCPKKNDLNLPDFI